MKITHAEIAKAAESARKKGKLRLPIEDADLAARAAELAKLNRDASALAERIDQLRAAQAALDRAILARDLKGQLKAERIIADIGVPLSKLSESLAAIASKITAVETEQEEAFATVTAEIVAPWWETEKAMKARSGELIAEAATISHAAAGLAHERGRGFDPTAVGIRTSAPWRAVLRTIGRASVIER